MAFSDAERAALLMIKGVGSTVIQRLEEMGIDSLAELATANVTDITAQASAMLGSTCWKNSPQAQSAIESAIAFAQQYSEMQ